MKKIIILFILSLFFFSCKGVNRQYVSISLSEISGQASYNDLYKDFECISLESSEKSIFGAINKLIVYDHKYFILDKTKMKKIFVFLEDGKFSHTIGKVGGGPGEYTNIEDFTIDKERQQLIILAYPSTVYIYNLKGEFIRKKQLTSNSMLWNIVSYKNGFVCSTNHQSAINDKLLFIYDKDLTLKKKLIKALPFQVPMPPFVSDPLPLTTNGVHYFDNFTSTIYLNVTDPSGLSVVHFDIDKKVQPEMFKDAQKFFLNQQDYSFFIDVFFVNDVFHASFFNKGKHCDLIYDIQSRNMKVTYTIDWRPKTLCYHNNYCYSSINPLNIIEERFKLNTKLITRYPIEIDSNPVILRYKIKN
ncbi:MAG: 6-bladed beta-propeller [Paludibacter sp.]|nr:6-bladed beta-propeller [Paludibacter sp.]